MLKSELFNIRAVSQGLPIKLVDRDVTKNHNYSKTKRMARNQVEDLGKKFAFGCTLTS